MPEPGTYPLVGLVCLGAGALVYIAFLITATAEAVRNRRTSTSRRTR